jgi:hypothetical protein
MTAPTTDEIQKAHDVLWAVHMREVVVSLPGHERRALHAVLDGLCWVLGHEHNQAFALNLAAVESAIERAGYRLSKRPP